MNQQRISVKLHRVEHKDFSLSLRELRFLRDVASGYASIEMVGRQEVKELIERLNAGIEFLEK